MDQSSFHNNDKVLLLQVSEGNETAFQFLFNFYSGKLYTYILRITKSSQMAEDTLHDVFLKLWENRSDIRNIDNLNAYLFRMAHNKAVAGLKRRAKEALILSIIQKEQAELPYNLEDGISSKEVKEFIYQAANKLTPQQKKVFLLSRKDGLKLDEIAETLQISTSTAKYHLVEALRILRSEVKSVYGIQAVALFVIHNLSFN